MGWDYCSTEPKTPSLRRVGAQAVARRLAMLRCQPVLFAALDVLTRKVIGQCLPRHRHEEFLAFLKTIDKEVPPRAAVHLILDNYSTHKHKTVTRWLKAHKRFHLHFHPHHLVLAQPGRALASASDREEPAPRYLRLGARPDRRQEYLEANNEDPRP